MRERIQVRRTPSWPAELSSLTTYVRNHPGPIIDAHRLDALTKAFHRERQEHAERVGCRISDGELAVDDNAARRAWETRMVAR